MIDGACVDNVELVRVIEGLGANVVTDTLCNGTRNYFPLVAKGEDPLDVLSRRYLAGIHCPKTYRENKAGTFEGDIADRFGDIGRYAKATGSTAPYSMSIDIVTPLALRCLPARPFMSP